MRSRRGRSVVLTLAMLCGMAALSVPLLGCRSAQFTLRNVNISPREVGKGEPVSIVVQVTNRGDAPGNAQVILSIDGLESREHVTVDGRQSTSVRFTVTKNETATYRFEIACVSGGQTVDSVEGSFVVVSTPSLRVDVSRLSPDRSLDLLRRENPALVDFVRGQPWYLDGVGQEERTFIIYGLGNYSWAQGIGGFAVRHEENDIAKDIIENERYAVEAVLLRGGKRSILFIYDDESLMRPWLELMRIGAPMAESYLGITYPKEVVVCYVRDSRGSYAGGGMLIKDGTPEALTKKWSAVHFVEQLIRAMWTTGGNGGPGGDTSDSLNGSIATLGAYLILEQIGVTHPDLLGWDYSAQEEYARLVEYLRRQGLMGTPLAVAEDGSRSLGFVFLKDLYDSTGKEAFARALGDLWLYKEPFVELVVGERELEEFALRHAPSREVVKSLFAERVWGPDDASASAPQ